MTIKDIIGEYGRKINRAFDHDRSKTVGASEIGLCARRVCMTKKGMKSDDDLTLAKKPKGRSDPGAKGKRKDLAGSIQVNWGAHVRGSAIEKYLWLPAMQERFGRNLVMSGEDQQTLTKGQLSGTPDGVVVSRGGELLAAIGVNPKVSRDVVVECKSIDPRVNLVEEKEENAFQVQVQMGLIRDLTPLKPDYAVISYVDASFWHDVAEFIVPFDVRVYEAAHVRARTILNAEPSDMKPEGWIAGGKECNWCPFARQCSVMRGGVPDDEKSKVSDQVRAELIDLAKQHVGHQKAAKDEDAKAREVQDEIKNRLRDIGIRRVQGIVNWYNVKGRESWDVNGMIAELKKRGADVEKFKSVGDPSSQVLIDKKVVLL